MTSAMVTARITRSGSRRRRCSFPSFKEGRGIDSVAGIKISKE